MTRADGHRGPGPEVGSPLDRPSEFRVRKQHSIYDEPVTNELLPSTAMVPPQEQRGKRPARTSMVLGVLAIVLVAAAALTVTVLNRDSGSGDPLFVLPVPGDDWQLTDGLITEPGSDAPGTSEQFIIRGRLFGIAAGDGFVDLRADAVYADSPLSGAQWEDIDTPWGDAYRRVDDSITIALPNYWNDSWQVASSPDDLIHAYDLLGNDIDDDFVIVSAFQPLDNAEAATTSFEMISPDGATFSVHTSPSAAPLFDAATFAERIEPVDVNGAAGWVVTDEQESGTETAVTWSPKNDRTVTVRSAASPAAVIDVARLLQPVSQDEWAAAFPVAPSD
jgi:hypothetical protein